MPFADCASASASFEACLPGSGFKQATVDFERPARAAGVTKYPVRKMVSLAVNGVISFSEAPLRAALWSGILVSALAIFYGFYIVALWTSDAQLVRGWSSTTFVAAFLGGANMMVTGIMGLYVGRIYAEVKARPLYLVDRRTGFDRVADAAPRESCPEAVPSARRIP